MMLDLSFIKTSDSFIIVINWYIYFLNACSWLFFSGCKYYLNLIVCIGLYNYLSNLYILLVFMEYLAFVPA